ncbi:MAG: acyl-CoA/acyl-ACP dehydrogenase [Chromatiales bacterium]|jgi:alkylation response protein AidB-like acyl-CoA dehydrogenase|nr:acyl-CoA/acyl-ACP dehydrogenase [Chromatiales bacterium]MDH4030452.1 acyl-CoA/acyl-ACP dehydrogenase [Chromatiales bacterium]
MEFSLSGDQTMLIEVVRDLLRKREDRRDEYLRAIYEEQSFPEELWEDMGQVGILGALVPEEYGGTGLGLLGMAIALEEFATHGLANAFCVLTTMANMAILRGGSEEQKRHWLPMIAEGKVKCAFAITEPDAGTNSFRMRSYAERDGDVYRLSGGKGWITGADVADQILVVARTVPLQEIEAQGLPRTHGVGLFLIDADAAGLDKQVMNTAGIEGFRQFMLYFDGIEVPLERRIGGEQSGLAVLFQALNPERILAAATAVGMSEFALSKAVSHAIERSVFGDTPIGAYQAVQHPLARVRIAQEGARLLTHKAAWLFDQQSPPDQVGHYANMAKLAGSELAVDAIDAAIQTHGGGGFIRDNHLINLWSAARLLKTAPINNEMILNQIAEHMLGLPRSY